ncbi:hypothetical protein F8M49_21100 [Rhodococcus zopfii]|uniref:Uncharacterized protein n=1 Tax=Rhodococcus zopfii TaxID=43772 RepID=A0ABU3WT90_9NOCA|nr:hypothetical protein [Rhodococcus zopfii]
MNAAAILDAIASKHRDCALIREVQVNDREALAEWRADWDRAEEEAKRTGDWETYQARLRQPCPPTARRIDGLLFGGGQSRTAIEVKISRADYQRETDAKRRMWRTITNRFVYATPAGLLQPDEIPDGCGLWEIDPDGRVTITKRAKANRNPEPIPHQVLVALAYRLTRKATDDH